MPKDRKVWHEAIKGAEDFKALIDQGKSWEDVRSEYTAPEWCSEGQGALGPMGCWSLIGYLVTGRDYCRTCEMSFDYKEPSDADAE